MMRERDARRNRQSAVFPGRSTYVRVGKLPTGLISWRSASWDDRPAPMRNVSPAAGGIDLADRGRDLLLEIPTPTSEIPSSDDRGRTFVRRPDCACYTCE